MHEDPRAVDLKITVGILKSQIATITVLCDKMEKVIDKLAENQQKMAENLYGDMDKRRSETSADIKDLHLRITSVDKNMSDKLESSEHRIMGEIKSLRAQIETRNIKEDREFHKILQWKWMLIGGIIVVSWLLSSINMSALVKFFVR